MNYKLLFVLLPVLFQACEKDDYTPKKDIVFEVAVNGYTATFKNQTAGGTSYKWDFGDGQTSTDENPVHTYAGKGKYVPTFYVTMGDGATYEGSTVLRISKSTAVKLNDNTLNDWDTVTHNVVVAGAGGGSFKKAKYDYDGNYVYFYFEMASAKANGDIFDFYLDSDNNGGTGLTTWLFTGGGYDVLLEGTMFDGWFDVYYHKGAQNSFTFDQQTISDFFEIGTVQESGGQLKFEGRLARSKIKGLTGKGLKIGVSATKNDWTATLGTSPDQATAAFVLDMSE